MSFTARQPGVGKRYLTSSLWKRRKMIINHTCVRLPLSSSLSFGTALICRYKDSCVLTRKGRPCNKNHWVMWLIAQQRRGEYATCWMGCCLPTRGMVCGCVWKKIRKQRWDAESERGREACFKKGGPGATFFFLSKERDDRWREELRQDEKKKWRNETEEEEKVGASQKREGSATATPLTSHHV